MTNREALLQALKDDDWEVLRGAASYIACPYVLDEDCHNEYEYGTADFQIYCDEVCKTNWLGKEFEG